MTQHSLHKLAFWILACLLLGVHTASAGTYTNDFTSPSGGIKDSTGADTGLTARLLNTGGSLSSPNDSLLTLGAGTLNINSGTTSTDTNGNQNPGFLEAIGIPLSTIGLSGNGDFSVSATYTARAGNFNFPDQFGIVVGYDDENLIRAGLINFTPVNGSINVFGANTQNSTDPAGNVFIPTSDPSQIAGSFTVTISRTAGVYSAFVDSTNVTPTQPTFLNNQPLFAGLIVSNINIAAEPAGFDATTTLFTATAIPEPGSLSLFGLAVAGFFAMRRMARFK